MTVDSPLARALREGRAVGLASHKVLLAKGGKEFPIDDSAAPIKDERGQITGVVLVFRDIADRKQVEEQLRRQQYLTETLVDNTAEDIYFRDVDGGFLRVDRDLADHVGLSDPDQATGSTEFDCFAVNHPLRTLPDDQQVMHSGQSLVASEYHETRADGPDGWVSTTKMPWRGTEGCVAGAFGMSRDASAHRQSEARAQALHRLAATGRLAAGIAHEFNNITTVMIGYAEWLQLADGVSEATKADLGHIISVGQRAARLIRQVLDFSRRSVIQPQMFDLGDFLQGTTEFLRRSISESTEIAVEVRSGDHGVYADPTQIQHVLTSLTLNARDAIPDGGLLRLRLSRLNLRYDGWKPFPSMNPGQWVMLSVSDTGTGIPPEVLPHIYESFFTTKRPGEGRGLGLAQVYGTVKQHDGFIGVETEVGRGATFTIYLPHVPLPHDGGQ